jgi:hypothetical protein
MKLLGIIMNGYLSNIVQNIWVENYIPDRKEEFVLFWSYSSYCKTYLDLGTDDERLLRLLKMSLPKIEAVAYMFLQSW